MKKFLLSFLPLVLYASVINAQFTDGPTPKPTCAVDPTVFVDDGIANINDNWEFVVINEVMVDAGQSDSRNDAAIELAGVPGTDIGGFVVTNGEWAVILPTGATIQANGTYLIACSQNTSGTFNTSMSGLTCADCDFPGLPIDFDVCDASNAPFISSSVAGYGVTFDNGSCGTNADGDQVMLFRPDGTPHDGVYWGSAAPFGGNSAISSIGGASGSCGGASDHISVQQSGSYYTLGDNDENGIVNDVIQSHIGRKADGGDATGVKEMPIGDYDPDGNGLTNAIEVCFTMPPLDDASGIWVSLGTSMASCNSSYMRIMGSNGSHGVGSYAQNPSHMDDPDLDTDWMGIMAMSLVPSSSNAASAAGQWGYSDHPNPGNPNDSDTWDFSVNGAEITAATAGYNAGARTLTLTQCPATPLTFDLSVYNYQHVEPNQDTDPAPAVYTVTPVIKAGSFVVDQNGVFNDWTTTATGAVNSGTTTMTFAAGTLPTGTHTFTLVWDDFGGLGSGSTSTVEGRAGAANQHECYEDVIVIVNVIEPLALDCGGEIPCNINCGAGDASQGTVNLSSFVTGGGSVEYEMFANGISIGANTSGIYSLPTGIATPLTATATSLDGCGTSVSFTITADCILDPPCPQITTSDFLVNGVACGSSASTGITELFFSEYIEGSSNNKCVEIYNGTGAPVSLANYSIQIYSNGSTSAGSTIGLTGTLADGAVHVVCNTSSAAAFLAEADQTSGSLGFNGDDAVVLVNNGTNIDIIGNIGCDPGSEWSATGADTQNNTIVRDPATMGGITTDPANTPCEFPTLGSEWSGLGNDNTSSLGSFTSTVTVTPGTPCTACPGDVITLSADGTDLPPGGSIDYYLTTASTDGTAYSNSTSGTYIGSIDIPTTPVVACNPSGGIIINEIGLRPSSGNGGGGGEYIELKNTSCSDITIGCMVVTDGDWTITIPAGTVLTSGNLYVIGGSSIVPNVDYIAHDGTTINPTVAGTTSATVVLNLTDGGEQVVLFADDRTILDAIVWGGGQTSPTSCTTGCWPQAEAVATVAGCNTADVLLTDPSGTDYEVGPTGVADNAISVDESGALASLPGTPGQENFTPMGAPLSPIVYTIPEGLCNIGDQFIRGIINPFTDGVPTDCDETDVTSATSEFQFSVTCPMADLVPLTVEQCVGDGTVDVQMNLTGLTTGNYLVTYIDLAGATQTLSVAAPATNPVTLMTVPDASVNGSISLVSVHNETSGNTVSDVTGECGGMVDTDEATIIIQTAPTAALSSASPITGCDASGAGSVSFLLLGGDGPFSYTYTDPNGNEVDGTSAASPIVIPASIPGTYTLTSVSTQSGCVFTTSTSRVVSTNGVTLPEFTVDESVDCGQGTNISDFSGTITVSITGGTGPYNITYPGGTASLPATGDVTGVGSNGTFTLVDANGCQALDQSFVFDVPDCELPVELISFTGQKKGSDVLLEWNTASEINNDYFAIEYSIDGASFEKIGEVRGSGNTTYEVQYDFVHENPIQGYNYYRLRQVDFDGSFEYSDVIKVEFKSVGNNIYVRPTVAFNKTTLVMGQPLQAQATIQVVDVAGRILITEELLIGVTEIELDIDILTAGHYFVRVKGTNETYTTRFVKQ